MSIWSDFQFSLSEAKYWQRNVNTALLYCCIVLLQQHVLIIITIITIMLNISNKKEKLRFILDNESYGTYITTEKMMIKTVRA